MAQITRANQEAALNAIGEDKAVLEVITSKADLKLRIKVHVAGEEISEPSTKANRVLVALNKLIAADNNVAENAHVTIFRAGNEPCPIGTEVAVQVYLRNSIDEKITLPNVGMSGLARLDVAELRVAKSLLYTKRLDIGAEIPGKPEGATPDYYASNEGRNNRASGMRVQPEQSVPEQSVPPSIQQLVIRVYNLRKQQNAALPTGHWVIVEDNSASMQRFAQARSELEMLLKLYMKPKQISLHPQSGSETNWIGAPDVPQERDQQVLLITDFPFRADVPTIVIADPDRSGANGSHIAQYLATENNVLLLSTNEISAMMYADTNKQAAQVAENAVDRIADFIARWER